ncbi:MULTISPECIES: glycosyltransferase [unclassified Microcoleus]|uniref:glycosyltransferase n=1 Tax=unclassified Microcoleus TaxID=2642155 RepID=UPI002FCEB982
MPTSSVNNTETQVTDSPHLLPIDKRYLLVLNIKSSGDEKGSRYLDPLWAKDLIQHFKYLTNFTLAAPHTLEPLSENTIEVDAASFAGAKFIDLPSPNSYAQSILMLPATIAKLWDAIASADIVHSGVAGWPIPMAWLVTPIVLIQRKQYLIVVESAPWRLAPGIPASSQAKILAHISERLNRWCINKADLTIFTQAEYQQSLLTNRDKLSHIINASWIDEENIISEADATQIWQEKISTSSPKQLKILFAGRLRPDKGVLVLLEAMKILDEENISIKLDILGEGKLLSNCQAASKALHNSAQIEILGTLPYGPKLFERFQQYHAVVVPSISDEQPRIVYDAYSQAVPILGSNTGGLRDCIENEKTGMLIAPNDPLALANLLKQSAENLNKLQNMGMAARKKACTLTHQEMHRQRWQLLLNMLKREL